MDLLISDHKPVYAHMTVLLRVIDESEFLNTQAVIMREIDKLENDSLPLLSVQTNQLLFAPIRYLIPQTKIITVENIGHVIASWRFVSKIQGGELCKKWLWVEPRGGILVPGEIQNIHFTIYVDSGSSSPLNIGEDGLEDILILHTESGKDLFMSISADWVTSSFGADLNVLGSLKSRAIRDTSIDTLSTLSYQFKNLPQQVTHSSSCTDSIPKELMRLVEFLLLHGTMTPNLFLTAGDRDICGYLRECLDTGHSFNETLLFQEPSFIRNSNKSLSSDVKEESVINLSLSSLDSRRNSKLQVETLIDLDWEGTDFSRYSDSVPGSGLGRDQEQVQDQGKDQGDVQGLELCKASSFIAQLDPSKNVDLLSADLHDLQDTLDRISFSSSFSSKANPTLDEALNSTSLLKETGVESKPLPAPPFKSNSSNSTVSDSIESLPFYLSPLPRGKNMTIYSFAETLLRWIEALPSPIIPYSEYIKILSDPLPCVKKSKEILVSVLPPLNLKVFFYLIQFLKVVISNSKSNDFSSHGPSETSGIGLTLDKVTHIFAPVLLRVPPIGWKSPTPSSSTNFNFQTSLVNDPLSSSLSHSIASSRNGGYSSIDTISNPLSNPSLGVSGDFGSPIPTASQFASTLAQSITSFSSLGMSKLRLPPSSGIGGNLNTSQLGNSDGTTGYASLDFNSSLPRSNASQGMAGSGNNGIGMPSTANMEIRKFQSTNVKVGGATSLATGLTVSGWDEEGWSKRRRLFLALHLEEPNNGPP